MKESAPTRQAGPSVEFDLQPTLTGKLIEARPLKPEDFDNPTTVAALAKAGNLSEGEFLKRFAPVVGRA